MAEHESRRKRWFGKEHNPKRASLVRQSIRYQLLADGLVAIGAWLWIDVGAVAGIIAVVLGVSSFGISLKRLVQATHEPQRGSPRADKAARTS